MFIQILVKIFSDKEIIFTVSYILHTLSLGRFHLLICFNPYNAADLILHLTNLYNLIDRLVIEYLNIGLKKRLRIIKKLCIIFQLKFIIQNMELK